MGYGQSYHDQGSMTWALIIEHDFGWYVILGLCV